MSEELTQEQQVQQQKQIDQLDREQAALIFMARNPEFMGIPENAKVLETYLVQEQLPYTADSLQQAFEACRGKLKLDEYVPPIIVVEPSIVETPVEIIPKWGYVLKNRKEVETFLSDPSNRAKHIKWSQDYYWGEEYRHMIDAALKGGR